MTTQHNIGTNQAKLAHKVHRQVMAMAKANGTTVSKVIESMLELSGNTCLMRLEEAEQAKRLEDAKIALANAYKVSEV